MAHGLEIEVTHRISDAGHSASHCWGNTNCKELINFFRGSACTYVYHETSVVVFIVPHVPIQLPLEHLLWIYALHHELLQFIPDY